MGIPVDQYELVARDLVLLDNYTLLGLPDDTVVFVQPSKSFQQTPAPAAAPPS